jgi:hypothetical protein
MIIEFTIRHDLTIDDVMRIAPLQKLYFFTSVIRKRKRDTERKIYREKKRQLDRTRICRQTINDCSIEPIAISLKKQE